MNDKPLLGISSCLLGHAVRYDGQHKLDHYLRDLLGQFVRYAPVCPEVECGLPVPREAMRLVDVQGEIRLLTQKSLQDITPRMQDWLGPKLDELARLPLCGFIFKSKSPSSGLHRVKVYRSGRSSPSGRGIFARAFCERFPLLPVEDEGRLNDPGLRDNFISRIFIMQRWLQLNETGKSLAALLDFHARHKYTLMAHDPAALRELGRMLAAAKGIPLPQLYEAYIGRMMPALTKLATRRKNSNVLQHIMGYFKKVLNPREKEELTDLIIRYHDGLVPIIVPITLLNHHQLMHPSAYLKDQHFLDPHPRELMLRNHV